MKSKTGFDSLDKGMPSRFTHLRIMVLCTIAAWTLCACGIVGPSAPAFVAEEGALVTPPLVQLDFEYEDAAATEATLLWNIQQGDGADASSTTNATEASAEASAGAGSEAATENAPTKTPMTKEGDLFSARISVPAGGQISYSLLIAKEGQDGIAEVQQAVDEDRLFTATEYGVLRIQFVETLHQIYAYSIFLPTPQVQQEVIYRAANAGEVYLVWTINDWQLLPESMRPENTEVTERYMYTPMTLQDDSFHALVSTPTGVKLNYSFVTTKDRTGAPVQIWESLAADRQPVVTEDGRLDVVAADAISKPSAAAPLLRDFTPPVATFIGLLALFGAALLAKQLSGRRSWTLKEAPLITVAASGISLYGALLLIRMYVADIGWISWQTTLPFVAQLTLVAMPDLIYAIVVTIAFCMLLLYAWPNRSACHLICGSFSVIMVVSIAFALTNAILARGLGQPLAALGPAWTATLRGIPAEGGISSAALRDLLIAVGTLSASALMASYLPQLLLSLFLSRPLAATMRRHYVYVPVGKFSRSAQGLNQPLQSLTGQREKLLLPYNSEL